MNNTIFNQDKRIQLLENMLYEQARQVAEKLSGFYKLFLGYLIKLRFETFACINIFNL